MEPLQQQGVEEGGKGLRLVFMLKLELTKPVAHEAYTCHGQGDYEAICTLDHTHSSPARFFRRYHHRKRRAVDVGIQNADAGSRSGKRIGQVHGDR